MSALVRAVPVDPPTIPARRSLTNRLPGGAGLLRVERVSGRTAVVACASTSPLRISTPRARGTAAWAITTTHGGGMVAGDAIHLVRGEGPVVLARVAAGVGVETVAAHVVHAYRHSVRQPH